MANKLCIFLPFLSCTLPSPPFLPLHLLPPSSPSVLYQSMSSGIFRKYKRKNGVAYPPPPPTPQPTMCNVYRHGPFSIHRRYKQETVRIHLSNNSCPSPPFLSLSYPPAYFPPPPITFAFTSLIQFLFPPFPRFPQPPIFLLQSPFPSSPSYNSQVPPISEYTNPTLSQSRNPSIPCPPVPHSLPPKSSSPSIPTPPFPQSPCSNSLPPMPLLHSPFSDLSPIFLQPSPPTPILQFPFPQSSNPPIQRFPRPPLSPHVHCFRCLLLRRWFILTQTAFIWQIFVMQSTCL
jgi:hypothetical protein